MQGRINGFIRRGNLPFLQQAFRHRLSLLQGAPHQHGLFFDLSASFTSAGASAFGSALPGGGLVFAGSWTLPLASGGLDQRACSRAHDCFLSLGRFFTSAGALAFSSAFCGGGMALGFLDLGRFFLASSTRKARASVFGAAPREKGCVWAGRSAYSADTCRRRNTSCNRRSCRAHNEACQTSRLF